MTVFGKPYATVLSGKIYLRPIVHLSSDILLIPCEGKNSTNNMHSIYNTKPEREWKAKGNKLVEYLGNKETYENIIIPNNVDGIEITTIGAEIFKGDTHAKSLTISDGIKVIEKNAFYGCSGLAGDLIIPDSVQTIEEQAFANCIGLIGNLKLGNSIQTIGRAAFCGCEELTGNLVIPDSVKTI